MSTTAEIASAPTPEGKCANCAKSTTLACASCKARPNATDGKASCVWYCGIECQKEHWDEHKTGCKAAQERQALLRAGATMQQIFYVYLKHSYMWYPGRIEKNGTAWLIYPRTYTGNSRLMPFPHDLFPDAEDQKALLSYGTCNAAIVGMHETFKILFRGLFTQIDEVTHYVKGAKYRPRRVDSRSSFPGVSGTDYVHTVMELTMESKEKYAVDFAGAQYGWHESVMPWGLYQSSRVLEFTNIVPFGYTRGFYNNAVSGMDEHHQWIHQISENFVGYVEQAIMLWEIRHGLVADIFRLPEDEYRSKEVDFLTTIDEYVLRNKRDQESKGVFDVVV